MISDYTTALPKAYADYLKTIGPNSPFKPYVAST